MKQFSLRLMAALIAFSVFVVNGAKAQVIDTIAGGLYDFSGLKARNISLRLSNSTIDVNGNLYFGQNGRIYKADANTKLITAVAGTGVEGFSGDGGPALSAQIINPICIAVDNSGNIYFSQYNLYNSSNPNSRIRKISNTGIITTIAGTGTDGFSGDGGAAVNAQLSSPGQLCVDANKNIFFADGNNYRIREISKFGIISTVAGNGKSGFSGNNVPAIKATLSSVLAITTDAVGDIFFVDDKSFGYNCVRQIDNTGKIKIIAGDSLQYGSSGDGGSALSAQTWATGLAVDNNGLNIYIGEGQRYKLRAISFGIINTIAGGIPYTGKNGGDGGLASLASLYDYIQGVFTDASGNIYIKGYNTIREINNGNGIINTVYGNGFSSYSGDGGPAKKAQLSYPGKVSVGLNGDIYFTEFLNNTVRKIDKNGIVSTIAGVGRSGFSGDGGRADTALLNAPIQTTVDRSGNVYVVDQYNNRVRKISANGIITTVAGNGNTTFSGMGGLAVNASFANFYTAGILVNPKDGNLYISCDNRIMKIDSATGIISIVAGTGNSGNTGDGGLSIAADINIMRGLGFGGYNWCFDSKGNLLINQDGKIRKIDAATGIINAVAGNGSGKYGGDGGLAINAGFSSGFIWTDNVDNIFILDSARLRKINSTGTIKTLFSYNGFVGFQPLTLDPSNGSIYIGGTDGVDYVVKIGGIPLPLQLIDFKATVNENKVYVSWQTATETNTARFNLQRSTNGNEGFTTIATLQAKGNSDQTTDYTYTDMQASDLNANVLYYRIQSVDKDGSGSYSKVVPVQLTTNHSPLIVISPNPVKDVLTIKVNGNRAEKAVLQVINVEGKVVKQQSVALRAGTTSISANIGELPKGGYVLRIQSDNNSRQQRFIKE